MATSPDAPSFGDKVRYQLDRFLSWSPLARFIGLFVLSFLLIVFCATLAWLVAPPDPDGTAFDFMEAMWFALTRVADAGTMGGDKGTAIRAVAILATICGVAVVALLIGLVSSSVSDKLDDLRKGKSPVIDDGHTLILGFNEKVLAILRELREANANQKSASIVILSETDKELVETTVREALGDMRTTRVIVRQGSPHSVHDLRKVGAGRARSIIILADAREGAEDQERTEGADDLPAIKTLLALRRVEGALKKNHAVVELLDSSRRTVVEKLGDGGVEVVAMAETLSRMMVQTARQNGLAAVYRDLLSYEGSEFYFKAFPELVGKTFGHAQWKMKDAVVAGIRKGTQSILNPPDDTLVEQSDELLVIAEDDDTFSLTADHQPQVPEDFAGAVARARQPERLLLCGLSSKLADMLKEFDNYVLPGSEIWLMPGQDKETFSEYLKAEVGSLKNLKLKYVDGDPTVPDALGKIVSPDFACALVVADTDREPDEADARTVLTVLLLRDFFTGLTKKPRIISEILDPRTKDLLEQDYGADFVVSAEMTSMLLAQVSERRDLNAVFADLFDSDGNEIYLKRAACFVTLGRNTPWLAVQKVARQRKEVAIGYLKEGATPLINPKQDSSVVFADGDRVIVISEDDSEAPGDSRGGELAEPPAPLAAAPRPELTPSPGRSPLVPPEPARPDAKAVSAGPRVDGPSTMPRPPLPPKSR